jgi:hypothetical protein
MAVKATISIPVTVAGYTGQRDAYETMERSHEVAVMGRRVTLRDARLGSSRSFSFEMADLEAALEFLRHNAAKADQPIPGYIDR